MLHAKFGAHRSNDLGEVQKILSLVANGKGKSVCGLYHTI